jgi:hypothetical protein
MSDDVYRTPHNRVEGLDLDQMENDASATFNHEYQREVHGIVRRALHRKVADLRAEWPALMRAIWDLRYGIGGTPWTQKEIAELTGKAQQTVSDCEAKMLAILMVEQTGRDVDEVKECPDAAS